MMSPTREEFIAKSSQGNLIPVWREVLADMETPVSAFRKIAGGSPELIPAGKRRRRRTSGPLLVSGQRPVSDFPQQRQTRRLSPKVNTRETLTLNAGKRDPLHVLKELLGRYAYVPSPELPPFVGGAVGMIGYDTVRFFEKLPTLATDDLGLDDCLFLFTDALLVFDNVKHKVLALCNARIAPGSDPGAAYDTAVDKVEDLLVRLKSSPPPGTMGKPA